MADTMRRTAPNYRAAVRRQIYAFLKTRRDKLTQTLATYARLDDGARQVMLGQIVYLQSVEKWLTGELGRLAQSLGEIPCQTGPGRAEPARHAGRPRRRAGDAPT